MGLCNIEYLPEIITKRRDITKLYKAELQNIVEIPKEPEKLRHNHGYFPVLFKNETELLHIFRVLAKENIFPRRYFYPSLNTLPFLAYQSCPISENIASRIACLPLYPQLAHEDVYRICALIKFSFQFLTFFSHSQNKNFRSFGKIIPLLQEDKENYNFSGHFYCIYAI